MWFYFVAQYIVNRVDVSNPKQGNEGQKVEVSSKKLRVDKSVKLADHEATIADKLLDYIIWCGFFLISPKKFLVSVQLSIAKLASNPGMCWFVEASSWSTMSNKRCSGWQLLMGRSAQTPLRCEGLLNSLVLAVEISARGPLQKMCRRT